jgi:hypothetical protein
MVRAWHERGMASVNQTRLHCINKMGKTHSKLLAARHGRAGTLCVNRLLNAQLNPICHPLELLGVHHIFYFSGLRVKRACILISTWKKLFSRFLRHSKYQASFIIIIIIIIIICPVA